MADLERKKTETARSADDKKTDKANGEAKAKAEEAEETKKAEELLKQKIKDLRKSQPRLTPHSFPDWKLEQMRECCMWQVQIFPIDQEDCKNIIFDTATKVAHKALYYVPKRKNGHGVAELNIMTNKDATAIMGRIIRTPFYHKLVTVELTRRGKDGKYASAPYRKIEETATVVIDTTRCQKIKHNAVARDAQKNFWIRYLSEKTTPDFLRVLFPLSRSAQIQTHDSLKVGLVEANSKPDQQLSMKAYVTVIINGISVLSIHNKEPMEKESETKAELEKAVQAFGELKQAPTDITDKHSQRRDDKSETSRIMKRTMHQQHVGEQSSASKRSRVEQPAQRGSSGNWSADSRWNAGSLFGSGSATGRGGSRAAFGGGSQSQINPRSVTAEMIMMQARLNQTIRTQLMMLNPNARRGFNTGFAGRFSGTGLRGNKGFGGGW